jgi:hypothetical protein
MGPPPTIKTLTALVLLSGSAAPAGAGVVVVRLLLAAHQQHGTNKR